jgi:hypothetical protein
LKLVFIFIDSESPFSRASVSNPGALLLQHPVLPLFVRMLIGYNEWPGDTKQRKWQRIALVHTGSLFFTSPFIMT